MPAVLKLVNALERQVGVALFDRSPRGLKLTAAGERYRDACRPAISQLQAADAIVRAGVSEPVGSVVVGAHAEFADMRWLSEFHGQFPGVQIDVRPVTRGSIEATSADVYLVHGWPVQPDLVLPILAQPRLLTCASPVYWTNFGMPATPGELAGHECLLHCNDEGTVNDLWVYQRNDETVDITASGWLVSGARTATIAAALAGRAVLRVPDLLIIEHLERGTLVPALREWTMADAPPFNIRYRAHRRRNSLTRVFMDFVVEAFRRLETEPTHRDERRPHFNRPAWSRKRHRMASRGNRVHR